MLQLVFPSLFQTDEFLDLLSEARLPGLSMLLARGRRQALGHSCLEGLLCQELGIARQQDWPIAPISLAFSEGEPGNDYWLRADPVHMRIERDQLILREIAEPALDESAALCEALSNHFGEEFSPQPMRPGAWVVRTGTRPDLVTTPLSQAAGKSIDPLLPTGSDALQWRKLLNEIQMLLFNHPVNQAREQRGEPVINSVWIWGGGIMPALSETSRRSLFCSHPDWQALARFSGADVQVPPEKWNPDIPGEAMLVLDEPHVLLRQGNFESWLQAMQNFESNWVQPLIASGRTFRMDDPLQGSSLSWHKSYRWKFWKRAQKPVQQSIKIEPPPSDKGFDEFGNRY